MNIKEEYYNNGVLKSIKFYNSKGQLHRIDKPAVKGWYDSQQKWRKEYWVDGKRHNENGPAKIEWYEDGQKMDELYYINGKFHNENGPAKIEWYEDGQIEREEYYINGNKLTKEEFIKLTSQKPVEVESKVQIPKQGGICRKCGCRDDYANLGEDGKVCCWQCR